MNTPQQHPDDREAWYRSEPFPGFAAPEQRGPAGSWTSDVDPLTDPMPVEPSVPASIAEEQEAARRQHAERVPRYAGPVSGAPGSPPGPASPGARAGSPPMGDAPASGGPAGPPPEARTNALPTVPQPGSGQPVSGQPFPGHSGAPPDTDQGIPPSLAPMLSHQGQPPVHHTERISTPPGYPSGGPAPGGYPPAGHPTGQQPGSGAPKRASGGTGNAGVLAAVVLATLLAVVPSVLLLYHAVIDGEGVSAPGVVGATLMLIGLPMLAAGIHPMIGGRASPAPGGGHPALRPPWAYLIVGLVLLVAAGLAVG